MNFALLKFLRSALVPVAALLALALAACFWESPEENPRYLPLDDSRYPYAEIPRVVIETEDFQEIRDRETEIPSRLQIYGKDTYESEVYRLTVRGRGNSSFKMPKYGMKLEFEDKVSLFGMPKSRDWALIANYGDKTLVRNYMMTRLSEWLGAPWTPKSQFVEVYLNRKYMGVYQFSETVKVAKNRVNMEQSDTSFLVEKEDIKKYDPPYVITDESNIYHIKSPKNPSSKTQELLRNYLNDFEYAVKHFNYKDSSEVQKWISMEDFLLFYWVQEFSKNEDGNYARSVYFSWKKGEPVHFGPLWDFDLAFGNASREKNKTSENWYIREYRLFRKVLWNSWVEEQAKKYWKEHREIFHALADSVPLYVKQIEKAVDNEYRRWPIISNTENWALKDPYESYEEAVQVMLDWMEARFRWIDKNI
jgi:hypothetical protein